MQIDSYTDKEIKEATKIIKNHKIDVLYFADTFGCLDNKSVLKIATSFQSNCDIHLVFMQAIWGWHYQIALLA